METNQIQHYNAEDEISLKEIILTILNERKLIAIITVITIGLAIAFTWYQSDKTTSAKVIVSFNFAGIEEHKNPDGSEFDPYQVATPYILSEVISKLNLENQISSNDIRQLIEIEPIVPKDITDQREFLMEKKGETLEYLSKEYTLTVHTNRKKHIDGKLAAKIADEIVYTYTDYFNNEYIAQKPVINKLKDFNIDKYDYSDVSMVVHDQINEIKSFNKALSELDPDFRSKRTSLNFSEINNLVDNTDNINLNKLDSIISSYKLTKDDNKLILYYEYLVEQLTFSKNKSASQRDVAKNMLEIIEDSSTNVADALNGKSKGEKSEKDKNGYFNSLLLKTANTSEKITDIEKQIAYYNGEIEDLKNGTFLANYNREAMQVEAEQLIQKIIDELKEWINLTNETANEFYDEYLSNSFFALSPAIVINSSRKLINLAAGAVAGIALGIFIALFKSYWNSEQEAK